MAGSIKQLLLLPLQCGPLHRDSISATLTQVSSNFFLVHGDPRALHLMMMTLKQHVLFHISSLIYMSASIAALYDLIRAAIIQCKVVFHLIQFHFLSTKFGTEDRKTGDV